MILCLEYVHNFYTTNNCYVWKPRDSIEVKDLVSSSHNVSKDRRDIRKRTDPMLVDYFNKICAFTLHRMKTYANDWVEMLYFFVAYAVAFYLWMRVDDFHSVKHKYLELSTNINDK